MTYTGKYYQMQLFGVFFLHVMHTMKKAKTMGLNRTEKYRRTVRPSHIPNKFRFCKRIQSKNTLSIH